MVREAHRYQSVGIIAPPAVEKVIPLPKRVDFQTSRCLFQTDIKRVVPALRGFGEKLKGHIAAPRPREDDGSVPRHQVTHAVCRGPVSLHHISEGVGAQEMRVSAKLNNGGAKWQAEEQSERE